MRHRLAAILPKDDESDTIRESSSASDERLSATFEDATLNRSGNDYKSEFHWTSVLNSATGSIGHEVELDSAKVRDHESPPTSQTVLLFDCGKTPSQRELVAGLPPRKTCDALVSSYFRIFNYNCEHNPSHYIGTYILMSLALQGFVHAGEFLKHVGIQSLLSYRYVLIKAVSAILGSP